MCKQKARTVKLRSCCRRQSVPLSNVRALLLRMLGTCMLQGMGEASATELQAAAASLGLLPAKNAADAAGGALTAAMQVPAAPRVSCYIPLSIDCLNPCYNCHHNTVTTRHDARLNDRGRQTVDLICTAGCAAIAKSAAPGSRHVPAGAAQLSSRWQCRPAAQPHSRPAANTRGCRTKSRRRHQPPAGWHASSGASGADG